VKKQKQFDCVQMKWKIQKKIENELRNLTDQVANKRSFQSIKKNKILGKVVRNIKQQHNLK